MDEPRYHLIHANLALARAPLGDPRMAGFVNQAEEIDALASRTQGFVDMPTPPDSGSVYTGHWMLNVSIWESLEPLAAFTYQGAHAQALTRRKEWFQDYPGPNYVLFWLPVGELPSEEEIKRRLATLEEHGPSPYAFTFDQPFSVQDMKDFGSKHLNA